MQTKFVQNMQKDMYTKIYDTFISFFHKNLPLISSAKIQQIISFNLQVTIDATNFQIKLNINFSRHRK